MNRTEFIEILSAKLKVLNRTEREKFITYYEEIIEDYLENGFTEEEVIGKIGDPKILAKNILSEQNQDTVDIKMPVTNSKLLNRILLVLGFPLWGSLVFAGLMIILSGLIVVWSIPFTAGVSALAFFIAGVFSIVATPFMLADVFSVGVVQLGVGIASIGVALLLAMATLFLCKKFGYFTKELSSRLLRLFNRKVVQIWL